MKFNDLKFKGFTLVELIIVITILSILSTISFISFQGYTKNARDSNRLSILNNIEKGLILYYTKTQFYPEVDNGVELHGSGGELIGYQGYIGESVGRLITFDKVPKDPLDNTNYLYSINSNKNKYQIMGFMEGNDYYLASLGVLKAYADYSTRYTKAQGNNLGIILDENNNPISENINIENYNGPKLKAIFNNNYKIEGTGSVLSSLKSSYSNGIMWNMLDTNCSLPDVVVGDQIWAGCNSTLGNGFDWGKKDDGTNGTIGTCYTVYSLDNNMLDEKCQPGAPNTSSTSSPKSWYSGLSIYNDSDFDTIWGKMYTWENAVNACPSGRHLPSDKEWNILENTLNGSVCRDITQEGNADLDGNGNGWECSGLGWRRNGLSLANNLAEKLKIPLAGNRDINGSNFNNLGRGGHLWTSSKDSGGNAYIRLLSSPNNGIYRISYSKLYGFSVRCIKD